MWWGCTSEVLLAAEQTQEDERDGGFSRKHLKVHRGARFGAGWVGKEKKKPTPKRRVVGVSSCTRTEMAARLLRNKNSSVKKARLRFFL